MKEMRHLFAQPRELNGSFFRSISFVFLFSISSLRKIKAIVLKFHFSFVIKKYIIIEKLETLYIGDYFRLGKLVFLHTRRIIAAKKFCLRTKRVQATMLQCWS